MQIKLTKIIEHPFILLLLHQPVYQTNPLIATTNLYCLQMKLYWVSITIFPLVIGKGSDEAVKGKQQIF